MKPSFQKPSAILSILIFLGMVFIMGFLRLYLFPKTFITLTYGLPLLVCLWHRDRKLLWAMAGTFVLMAAYKSLVLMPDPDPADNWELAQLAMQITNIFIIGGTVDAILRLTDRLRLKNQQLEQANFELVAREEEISRQNEELQVQSEELVQQNEEIQVQSEELVEQNEEVQQQAEELQAHVGELNGLTSELLHREEMLQIMLDSFPVEDELSVLQKMCKSGLDLFGTEAQAIAILEIRSGELLMKACEGANLVSTNFPLKHSFAEIVNSEGRTAFVEDLELRRDLAAATGGSGQVFRSVLGTPVCLGDEAVGVVEVFSYGPRQWNNRQFHQVEWIAKQAALVIHTARVERDRRQAETELANQNERLRLLSEALASILTAHNPDEVATKLFPVVSTHLRADTYFNFLVDEGDALKLNACVGIPADAAPCLECLDFRGGICGLVLPQNIQERNDPLANLVRTYGIRTYGCNPLLSGERLIGTLSFGSRQRDQFSEGELHFLRTISQYVAIAMERFHTEEQLRSAKKNLESEVNRRTASLREAVSELEHFSYTITHDMRAPLRSMTGFSQILLDESADVLRPEHREFLHKIVKSADRMDALIRDALDYNKIVREQIALTPIDTHSLLKDMIESYSNFQTPNASIQIDGELPEVLGTAAGLTQCFSNLLNNAVKFVRPGETPAVRIWATNGGENIRLWFEDNGIGIEKDHQASLFRMFQRLNQNYEGTGIGLALVRKVIERMGGKVGVESEPGQGSRFWVELKPAFSPRK